MRTFSGVISYHTAFHNCFHSDIYLFLLEVDTVSTCARFVRTEAHKDMYGLYAMMKETSCI